MQGITDNLGRFTPFASPVANSRSMHKEQVEKVCIEILERKLVVACEDFAIVPFGVSIDQPPIVEHLEYRCTLDRDTTSRNNLSHSEYLLTKATRNHKSHRIRRSR